MLTGSTAFACKSSRQHEGNTNTGTDSSWDILQPREGSRPARVLNADPKPSHCVCAPSGQLSNVSGNLLTLASQAQCQRNRRHSYLNGLYSCQKAVLSPMLFDWLLTNCPPIPPPPSPCCPEFNCLAACSDRLMCLQRPSGQQSFWRGGGLCAGASPRAWAGSVAPHPGALPLPACASPSGPPSAGRCRPQPGLTACQHCQLIGGLASFLTRAWRMFIAGACSRLTLF